VANEDAIRTVGEALDCVQRERAKCEKQAAVLKVCTECGELLPATAVYFPREGLRRKGKLRSKCKQCCAAYAREYVAAHREQVRKRQAAYYRANRERFAQNVKRWRARNPEKVREYNKKTYRQRKRARLMRVLSGRN
jgi:hypothetical protein